MRKQDLNSEPWNLKLSKGVIRACKARASYGSVALLSSRPQGKLGPPRVGVRFAQRPATNGLVEVYDAHSKTQGSINSSSDEFGNAPGMLSLLCSGFRTRLLFVE